MTAVCCRVKSLFANFHAPRAVERIDRGRFHPCTRIWNEPSCRGRVGERSKLFGKKTSHATWIPGARDWGSHQLWMLQQLRRWPHLCEQRKGPEC